MWKRTLRPAALCAYAALCFSAATYGQPYWVRHVGSLGNEHVSDVKVDETGDIYITGEFSGDADFIDSTFTAQGGIDCFVAKLSAAGEMLWWKQGGGYGIDRGIKLAFGPNNTLAVVGEFMGSANFQGVTITSQSFTPDMFCMVLDRATGTQQWIRHGGGSEGADRPYGVTVSSTGQVTMAGEFRGPASWDGFTLTSIIEQDTTVSSMDVVVVSYDVSGTALWVQQGATDRSDRAIDVVNDPQGNIYVAGQFSDTITFDVEHLNAMYNATFLLKLDPAGNEVWFRRCGGAIYDHVRDLLFTPDGQLLLTGDLQGTMIFMDDVPDFVSGELPYNYYLLRVSTDGQLIAQGQIGSDNGLSSRGIDLRNDTITVTGQFNCQFTSMSSQYDGEGLFMAAGAEDIFVTRHRYSDLGFIEARHYGGPGAKLAGQVATLPNNDVLVCGSYTRSISFATTDENPIGLDSFEGFTATAQPSPPSSCPELDNTTFRSQDSRGLKDGFLARAFVRDSVVYDWWSQDPGVCDHPATWTMCAGEDPGQDACQDTLENCGPLDIGAHLPFIPSSGGGNSVGPLVNAVWNNGDSALSSHITETGLYSVEVEAMNGCWSWSDAVYVIIHPIPPKPHISDDVVVNTDAVVPADIHLCDPDSALLWCNNLDTNFTYYWTWEESGAPTDTGYTASIMVDTSGYWTCYMASDAGCVWSTWVNVVDHIATDLDSLDVGLTMEIPDSMDACPGTAVTFDVVVYWILNGDTVQFPLDLLLYTSMNDTVWQLETHPNGWSGSLDGLGDGWNIIHLQLMVLNGACGGDTLHFQFTDSVWVHMWPGASVALTVSGASTMCVGDSTLLTVDCPNCTSFTWSGGNVNGATTATVWATDEGTYTVVGGVTDQNGCSAESSASHQVSFPAGPLLLMDPLDGIICPQDSALVYTLTPGTGQVWYGPYGPVPNESQQLWTTIPGEYYLNMIDTMGCELVSDPALITAYSTPYLNVIPDNVLCLYEENALIQVNTTAPSTIVWAPPFSGSALMQTVTEPGVYSVTSTACGITTEMSVTVIASEVAAQVAETGPFDLCEGESVVLHALPGPAVFIWQPGDVFADSLVVTTSGDYTLQVVDGNGCADTSAVVVVNVYDIAQLLQAAGDTICAGQPATITALGSGLITWYSDASTQDPLFIGSPIVLNGLTSDTTFYVVQVDGPCTSEPQAAVVIVEQEPPSGTVDAPTVVCGEGEAIITFIGEPGVNAQWITPNGTFTGTQLIITDFSAGDSGVYTAYPFNGGCTGDPISTTIGFALPAPFSIGPDTTYCVGGWYTLVIPDLFTQPVWSTGTAGYVLQVDSDGTYTAYAIDVNGCAVQDEAYLSAVECGPIIPNIITPNGDGNNDVFTVLGSEGFTLAVRIYNRWGMLVWESSGQDIRWNGHDMNGDALVDGVYYYEILRTGLHTSQAYTGYVHILRGR